MLQIPEFFAERTRALHGARGQVWLDGLPAVLSAAMTRWDLRPGTTMSPLTFHFVMTAQRQRDGLPVVLKACSPTGEFLEEATALRIADGAGMARLLASDDAHEVLLLERLEPGTMLRELALTDDDAATRAAAMVMQALWQPVPAQHPFPTTAQWSQGLERLRTRYAGGTGPIPHELVAEAERLYAWLSLSAAPPVVLHGDLHHDNILAARRAPWLAIDPKGLIGEPAYETGALLRNPLPELLRDPHPARILDRRIAILSETLAIDRARLIGWGIYQAVLSAWWSIEDFGEVSAEDLAIAEVLRSLAG